jgi:uncharacterized RDD family membrane protein YckC
MVMALTGRFVYGAPFAAWVVLLAAPLFGATPGQRLAGLVLLRADGRPPGPTRRAARFALATLPLWLIVLGLAAARWELVAAGAGAALFTMAWRLGSLRRRNGDAWYDAACGTRIVRQGGR